MTEYAERPIDSDELCNHYARHVNAMTGEGLHSKSDIAAELAWRDARIAELEQRTPPEGMALVPREITAETGHKAGMMSEFSQSIPVRCEACDGDGLGRDEEYGGCDEYAEAAPFLWRLEAESVFRADNGEEYRHVVELETSQAQLLGELTDTWRDMLDQVRDGGNPRHHSHDVVRAWPLVTRERGDV